MSMASMEKGALFGKYEVGRLLGCGAFAKVYYARNLCNGQGVAIKVINKKKIAGTSLMANIKREITIMRRLRHPNIVRLHEVLASKSKIYFVMEYVKGGELFAKVAKGRFSEDLARTYFRQLVSAIAYCHSRAVFHRDLKPENLLLDDKGDLKVSDFGLSAAAAKDEGDGALLLRTLCGTPAYVAPEILAKKGYHGAMVDVWSCGVVLFVLTAGYLPFNDPNLMAMYKKIYKGDFRCPKWMSSDLKRLLSRLLHVNPATRITLDQITRDPWFTKGAPAAPFSLYHDDFDYQESLADKHGPLSLELGGSDSASTSTSASSSSSSLNAFDLISFSSGLDLSGLFDESFNPIVDGDKFMSEGAAHEILDKLEQLESAELKMKRRKEWGVDLQLQGGRGPSGSFVARVEIRPLTDSLVVVEVLKIAGDSAAYNHIWKTKVRPHLAAFVYGSPHPAAAAADPEPEPEPEPEPPAAAIQLPASIDESN